MENQKTHSKALESLNKSLAPVTFLVGHSVTLADFAVWGALKGVEILSCYFLLFYKSVVKNHHYGLNFHVDAIS